ncbi:tRNA (guanosine(37)-N1)-methyltransferase TrmD, partial [Candidatus Woesearchaeota archaeon]|nr:tRNA (guanosine(37)-N1)-methyltransferase TrmD [Candidatus Woesearchaeota archaeon]
MQFDIITIFPELIDSYSQESILGRAQKNKLIKINAVNLRKFTTDKHKQVDDTPYGGGPGMVMKPEPFFKAVKKTKKRRKKSRVILLTPRGQKFDQKKADELTQYDQLIFLTGRYEGIDERVHRNVADEEISVGDYVLSGGELPALIITETVARLLPGVLGNQESLLEESFTQEDTKEYP